MLTSNQRASQCIAFVHNKGGTGKTTACINVAGWLTKMNKKVLVVDLDPKGNATSGLGIDLNYVKSSLIEVLKEKKTIQEVVFKTDSGVYCIPSSLAMRETDFPLIKNIKSEYSIKKILNPLHYNFDYILLDVAPSMDVLMQNAVVAANSIIIPVNASVFCIETLSILKHIIEDIEEKLDLKPKIKKILLTDFSFSIFNWRILRKMRQLAMYFAQKIGLHREDIRRIPFSYKILEAQFYGMPISHYAPDSSVSKAYQKIAKQFVKK